jgi:sugar lactone lactonase YvrE
VHASQDGLGEAPVWVEQEQSLYWSDHVGCTMKRWNTASGEVTVWDTPGPVGSFAFREGGGMVGGTDSGFCRIDLEAGIYEPIVDPEADMPGNRFNDGKCDRRGRFWCGSMNKEIEAATGSIYCLRFDRLGLRVVRAAAGASRSQLAWRLAPRAGCSHE